MRTPIYTGLFQSDLDASGYRLIGLPAPSAGTDAANKAYVDAHAGGGGGGSSTVTINVKDAPYSATGDGVTDDTAAIQSALNALSDLNGGVLFFPKGTYLVNGAFDGTTNSILKIPMNSASNPIKVIELRGENPGTWIAFDQEMSSSGAIIKSTKTGTGTDPSILAAGIHHNGLSAVNMSDWNAVTVYLRDLTFRTYDNPSISGLRLATASSASLENVTIDTGTNPMALTQPSHGTFGVWMPNTNNYGLNYCDRVEIIGYGTAFKTGEHFTAPYAVVSRCGVGIEFLFAYHPSEANLNFYHVPIYVKFSAQHPVSVLLDIEHATSGWWQSTTGNDVVDVGNVGSGEIRYIIVTEAVGNTTTPISVTGCTGIRFINLYTGVQTNTIYIGTDARLVPITGGTKLEVRNASTGTWVEATRYTNP